MNMFGIEPLVPAYGRIILSKEVLEKCFKENKDFQCVNGSYTNREDLKSMGYTEIDFRYGTKLDKKVRLKV